MLRPSPICEAVDGLVADVPDTEILVEVINSMFLKGGI